MLIFTMLLLCHALYHRRCSYMTSSCDTPLTCTFTEIGPCLYRSTYSSISMNVTHSSYRYVYADTQLVSLSYQNEECFGDGVVQNVETSPKCRYTFGVYVQDVILPDMNDGHIVRYEKTIITRNPRHMCNRNTAIEALYGQCIFLDDHSSAQYSVENGVLSTRMFKDPFCHTLESVELQEACNSCERIRMAPAVSMSKFVHCV